MKIVIATHGFAKSIYKVGSFHIAKCLASIYGHEVLSISIPLSPFHIFKIRNSEIRRKFKTMLKGVYRTEYGFWEYIPFLLIPSSKRLVLGRRIIENLYLFSYPQLRSVLYKNKFSETDILIVEHSNLSFLLNTIYYKKLIYRVTDIYPSILLNKKLYDMELYMLEKSDNVVVTSIGIKEFIIENFGKYIDQNKITVIENGVDINHFLRSKCKDFNKPHLFSEYKHIVIYIGSIDRRLDFDLCIYSANMLKNLGVGFFLFGKIEKDFSLPKKIPDNLHIMGSINYNDLPCILKLSDVGILPFRLTKENEGRSPMKLYEYGIMKLPVVSTYTKDIVYKQKREKFILVSKRYEDFVKNIKEAITKREILGNIAYNISLKKDWKFISKKLIEM